MRIHIIALGLGLLATGGCGQGGGDKPKTSTSTDRAKAAPAEDLDHAADHSREALATVKDTVGGVTFSIDLPAGLAKEQSDKDTGRYDSWTFAKGNPFLEPSITVQILEAFAFPADLDAAVRQATAITANEQRTVATQKATAQGYLVSTQRPDGQFLSVECWARQGDHVVRGSFTQRTGTGRPDDQPIPSLDATRAWAESICASLRVE